MVCNGMHCTEGCVHNLQDTAMSVIPHVESSLMATDSTGLKLLQRAGCFKCYDSWRKAKVSTERCFWQVP